MKYNEEQVVDKAKKIMSDLLGKYYSDQCISTLFFNENELIQHGQFSGQELPCWTVSINSLFDNLDFLFISDKTNEPLYYHNFNMNLYEVLKDSKGGYYKSE